MITQLWTQVFDTGVDSFIKIGMFLIIRKVNCDTLKIISCETVAYISHTRARGTLLPGDGRHRE